MMTGQATGRTKSDLPDELRGSVPRDVRLTAGGAALAALAGTLAAAAVASAILMSIAYGRAERAREFRARDGRPVQAQVVGVALRRGDHPQRVITYQYEVSGRLYTGRTTLREGDRRAMAEGTPVFIRYLASDPNASWMIGYEPAGIPLLAIPLVSAGLLVAGGAAAWGLRRQWILLSEGRVALARVTSQKRVQRSHHKAYQVACEFRTLSGATRTTSYESMKAPPPVGTTFAILYHRDNPAWTARYPLQLVQPERARQPGR